MTKEQLLARYNDKRLEATRLYLELEKAKKDINVIAGFAGRILSAVYSLGITENQLQEAMTGLPEEG